MSMLDENITNNVKINVVVAETEALLEHNHTNYTMNDDGTLEINIVSFPFYESVDSWNPISVLAPTYQSARDVSCKMLSADRIAQQFMSVGNYPQDDPPTMCTEINKQAVTTAFELLEEYWPMGKTRFGTRGNYFTF